MISPYQVLVGLIAVLVVLFVIKAQKLKEQANFIGKRFCRRNDLQFLDGTVAFQGLHFDRSSYTLVFRFRFEYSTESVDRHTGTISFIGNRVQNLFVDPEHIKS